jgi:hypothetical protein
VTGGPHLQAWHGLDLAGLQMTGPGDHSRANWTLEKYCIIGAAINESIVRTTLATWINVDLAFQSASKLIKEKALARATQGPFKQCLRKLKRVLHSFFQK